VKRKVCENNSSPETKNKKKPQENVDEETIDEDLVRRRYLTTIFFSKSEYSDYLKKRKIHKLDKIKGKEDLPILPVPILLKSDESLEDYENEFCKWLQSKDIHLRDIDVDKERSLRTAYTDLRFKNKLGSKKLIRILEIPYKIGNVFKKTFACLPCIEVMRIAKPMHKIAYVAIAVTRIKQALNDIALSTVTTDDRWRRTQSSDIFRTM